MAQSHVISGLVAKRAEVAGQITHLDAELRRLRAALEHLDATLIFLDPTIKPAGIRSRRMPHRPPMVPDLARRVLDLMRAANAPRPRTRGRPALAGARVGHGRRREHDGDA